MNGGKYILFWGLCVLAIMSLTGCIMAVPPPKPSSSLPKSLEEMTDQDIRDQITVLECPAEARIGQYITVRLQIGNDEFWDWLREECVKIDEDLRPRRWCSYDPFFSAYIDVYREGEGGGYIILGKSRLDNNYEAVWYLAIPEKDTGGIPIKPGVYPLIVEIGEALGSVDVIFERNIIIKE